MKTKLVILTATCEEDKQWFSQYLNEITRINMSFVIHFDRCSDETKSLFRRHPLCVGSSEMNDPNHTYGEMDKQMAFDVIPKDYDWMMPLDIDETMEKRFNEKVETLDTMDLKFDIIDCPWWNLWDSPKHIRIDGPCQTGHRVKFYNLHRAPLLWKFYHPTINGMTLFEDDKMQKRRSEFILNKLDISTLHWGLMTKELRESHKARWDRIYSSHVGKNPYGFWDWMLDEKITPVIREHDYL